MILANEQAESFHSQFSSNAFAMCGFMPPAMLPTHVRHWACMHLSPLSGPMDPINGTIFAYDGMWLMDSRDVEEAQPVWLANMDMVLGLLLVVTSACLIIARVPRTCWLCARYIYLPLRLKSYFRIWWCQHATWCEIENTKLDRS